MAELKKPLFGNIKGSFGNAVFRQRNGKNYLVQKPSNYRPPSTEDYFIRTTKFKIASKISSIINSDSTLKEIWYSVKPKNQTLYNYLISVVYPSISIDSINSSLRIVPNTQIGVRLNNASIIQDKLTVNLHPLTNASLIDSNIEKNSKIISIVTLINPINVELPNYDSVLISSNLVEVNIDDPLTFEFILSTTNQQKLSSYQNKSLFSTLVTYDENSRIVHFSNTFYSDLG